MGRKRTPMNKIREVLRQHFECHLSIRSISRSLGISRPVISEYVRKFKKTGLKYSETANIPDDDLLDLISEKSSSEKARYAILRDRFNMITKELKRTGVTLYRLWEEYKLEEPSGYSYSQFCYHYQIWRNMLHITMHVEHKAGDKMFVDFTGKKLEITDPITGEKKPQEVFVAILGASQLTYVEAVSNQKKADWLNVNQNAMRYFGGVPCAIVPDCLKSGVTKGNRYEPDINPEYCDFARHFDTVILPARPYKPKDKALVENAVKIVYRWIFASLRDRVFFSLSDLNQAIREELERYNNKPMQRLKMSRRELFEQTEASALKPLPAEKYELRQFKSLKVQFNYHVYLSVDRHYYSVPYKYRGKHVMVVYTQNHVEVFKRHIRVAFHMRDRTPGGYTTLAEHMPEKHRWITGWTPGKFISSAADIGPSVRAMTEAILNSRQHPEQAYRACLGLFSLCKNYGSVRLNKACARALNFRYYSYKGVKNILESGLEETSEEPDLFSTALPDHGNIRGSDYYSAIDNGETGGTANTGSQPDKNISGGLI